MTDEEKAAAAAAAAKEAADKAAAEAAVKAAADKAAKEKADAEAAEKAAKDKADKDTADKAAADAAEKARKEAEAEAEKEKGSKLSEGERKLLHEVMERKDKERAARKEADEAKAKLAVLEKEKADANAAAEKAKRDAEKEAAEKSGDFERLKKMMAEENAKEKKDLQDKIDALSGNSKKQAQVIDDLTVGAAFNNSKFITDELVLTPTIARQVYSNHFDIENGKIVAFDKPRGEANRTRLVNSSGDEIGFEDAMKKLVEASPERDKMLRSKLAPGAGVRKDAGNDVSRRIATTSQGNEQKGVSSIAAAIAAGALKTKK